MILIIAKVKSNANKFTYINVFIIFYFLQDKIIKI